MTSRPTRLYAAIAALLLLGLGAHANGQNVLSLDRTSYTVAESAGNASIIVRLARTNTDTVTVNYTTNDGTALAGADYTATNGTLTFAPNETAKLVQIPILDDLTPESTEQFMLMISNPSGATIDPAKSSATVMIQDNDGSATIIGFESRQLFSQRKCRLGHADRFTFGGPQPHRYRQLHDDARLRDRGGGPRNRGRLPEYRRAR